MEDTKQFYFNGNKVEIITEFEFKGNNYAVCDDGNWFVVARKSDLQKWEDTDRYKQEQATIKRTEEMRKNRKELAESIKNEAIKSMIATIRLNLAFGSVEPNCGVLALEIIKSLEKIIKEKEL